MAEIVLGDWDLGCPTCARGRAIGRAMGDEVGQGSKQHPDHSRPTRYPLPATHTPHGPPSHRLRPADTRGPGGYAHQRATRGSVSPQADVRAGAAHGDADQGHQPRTGHRVRSCTSSHPGKPHHGRTATLSAESMPGGCVELSAQSRPRRRRQAGQDGCTADTQAVRSGIEGGRHSSRPCCAPCSFQSRRIPLHHEGRPHQGGHQATALL